MSKLTDLADHCNAGAQNVAGLLIALGAAVKEYANGPAALRCEPSLKCIIGHISFLLGESFGPTSSALEQYTEQQNKK
jgi:hypothetical protein